MRPLRAGFFPWVLLFFMGCEAGDAGLGEAESMARSVTIYRDTLGVPHIYGPTDASVVFGYMYAQAEDRFDRIENNYIRLAGRLSEVQAEIS